MLKTFNILMMRRTQYTLLKCFLIYQRKFILFQIRVFFVLNSVKVGSLHMMGLCTNSFILAGPQFIYLYIEARRVTGRGRLLGLNGLLYVKHASMGPSTYESQHTAALTDAYSTTTYS